MSKVAQKVGERIRIIRQQRDISQEQLAFRAGLTPSYVGQLERGQKSPTVDTLDKISSALNVTLEDLFSFDYPNLVNINQKVIEKIAFQLSGRTESEQEAVYNLIKQILIFRDKGK
ncbi:XRE family transcriptional regulator [Paenibacillus sp. JMULE4]|uniref:helix-turn-helix domain-containing protein n=1 Tax=Paenibacillus TaxID=44249 RepID=UPI000FDA17E4|nr:MULTISPECIES: helix-turn-helix transcriptional regulator [Paenibacillus]NTZ20973.1 XRE family transcriptional regulator [Paenibacillus sp. JMULE4]